MVVIDPIRIGVTGRAGLLCENQTNRSNSICSDCRPARGGFTLNVKVVRVELSAGFGGCGSLGFAG